MAASSIRERIKAVRTALNLSQMEFCRGIFISQSLYAKIETGERKPTQRIFELMKNPGASSWVSSLDRKFIILVWSMPRSKSWFTTFSVVVKFPEQARTGGSTGYGPHLPISNKYKVNKDWIITGQGDMFSTHPPDVELDQLLEIIKGLDPLFRDYISKQIRELADLHRKSKEQGQKSALEGGKPQ
jgi:hypothetical protein